MSKQTIIVTTDSEGKFHATTTVQDPVWGMTVSLKAAVITPPNITLSGTFALGSHTGRAFVVATGQTVDLGEWKVAHGMNTVSASGQAESATPNTAITVEISW